MIAHDQTPEHEFEAQHGLPETLPAGERIVWQGSPDWRVLARDVMHLRAMGWYFGLLLVWRGATVLADGGGTIAAVIAVSWLLPIALIAVAMMAIFAWLISRTCVYTITNRRVVMRIGVVLTITFNLPFSRIESAGLHANADGSGDLCLLLDDTDRIAYAHLWPHARPWHVKRTQPMMRALPQAHRVAALLSAALADSAGMARTRIAPAARAPLADSTRPATNPATDPVDNAHGALRPAAPDSPGPNPMAA